MKGYAIVRDCEREPVDQLCHSPLTPGRLCAVAATITLAVCVDNASEYVQNLMHR